MMYLIFGLFVLLSAGLAWFMISQDQGEREPIWALWMAFGFGVAGAMLAIGIEKLFLNDTALEIGAGLKSNLAAVLIVGLVEETCKFVPLALAIYKRRFFNEHTDGVIYFALAGLGFGLPENIAYTAFFGVHAGAQRVILTPFFHAALTGMLGYCLIRIKLSKRSPFLIVVPLLFAIGIHALYDFGLSSGSEVFKLASIFITVGLSGLLFVLFFRAKALDQNMGLSAIGHNKYCRFCGYPNAAHHLYCTHCGKNT